MPHLTIDPVLNYAAGNLRACLAQHATGGAQ